MDNEKINRWLQLAANIGILVGLVLVGFQMKQNSDLLEVQLSYSESDRLIESTRGMLGENPAEVWAKSLTNPLELSLSEQLILEAWLFLETENWVSTYALSNQGLRNIDWRSRIEEDANYFLNNPYGLAYFEHTKVVWPDELVEFVEYVLEANPAGALKIVPYQDLIMEDVKKHVEVNR